jgi:hypothetical protein
MIIGMRTILPLLDTGCYVEAACIGIACVAVLYRLTPLALAVEKSLLSLAGRSPLKGNGPETGETR